MTITAKTKLVKAETVKKFLLKKNLYDNRYLIQKEGFFIYFPIKKKVGVVGAEVVQKNLSKIPSSKNLRLALSKKLSKNELTNLIRSYDVIGTIAILNIPNELEKKEEIIAKEVLKLNKNIKTVLKKLGIHSGEFRTQKLKWLVGEKTKEALYKENGILIQFDLEKVYFSMRLSTERKRISQQIKTSERVLVMFSGCAPYALVISKNSKAKEIYGVEKNRVAHNYGLKNIKLNKIININLLCGDVKKVIPKLNKKFDRVLMPLPKSAENFLELIPLVSKKGTTIHFYTFGTEKDVKTIKSMIKKKLPNTRILRTVKCGNYSPSVFRLCIDFKITSLK